MVEKVNVGVRELWPTCRADRGCRGSRGQGGKGPAAGVHPTSPGREQGSLPGDGGWPRLGRTSARGGSLGREARQDTAVERLEVASHGWARTWRSWAGLRWCRGEDSKAHVCPQDPDGMEDCLLQKTKGFKIIIVLSVVFRTNISRWSVSRKETWGWQSWLPKGCKTARSFYRPPIPEVGVTD